VFIDEIDAVGRHRGAGLGGGHDEREQTLNQLLVEMDGFGVNDGVIVIAATNRPDILDPALMRPGRFDRQVTVNYPDLKGRAAILRVHARNKPLGQDVDLDTVAKSTVGMTGADLSNVLNEAALLAARRKKNVINMKEIEDATLKILVGPQKRSLMISESDKRKTAYHEAGHAIVGHILPTQDPVHQISIIPSGHALGYTLSLPESDKTSVYRIELQEEIATLLGGRVAEALILDDISGGASQDIQRATEIARKMVTRYGMSDKLGPIVYGNTDENVFLGKSSGYTIDYSEEFASAIDNEIYRIVTDGYQLAEKILKENMAILHFVADYLVKHETMDAEQFKLCFTADVTEEQVAALHPSEPELIVNPASEEILPEGKPSRSQIEEDGDFS
jgi:cell division protease FtsH